MRFKTLLPLAFSFCFISIANAQKPDPHPGYYRQHAKLLQLQSKKDTAYVNALITMGDIHSDMQDYDSAIWYFNRGAGFARSLDYHKGLYTANNDLGESYMFKLKHDSAIRYFLESLTLAEKTGRDSREDIAEAKQGIAAAYLAVNDTINAMKYLNEVVAIMPELTDTIMRMNLHGMLAFRQALRPDTMGVIREYKNGMALSDAYEKNHANDTLKMSQLDKARITLVQNLYLFLVTPELRVEAIRYMEAIWKRSDWPHYRNFRARTALMLAGLYERIDDYKKAIAFGNIAIEDGSLKGDDIVTLYSMMAMSYYNNNQFKEAADYLVQLNYAYIDRFDRDKLEAIGELEKKYQTQQKEQEIINLNKQKKNQRMIIIISVAGFGIALFLLLFVLRAKRLQQKLFAKEKELQKNEMEKRMFELEQTALRAQMNPHFIFNSLNSVQRYVINNDPEGVNMYLSTFANLIRQTLENSGKQLIPLKDEVRYLETYLRLEQMRGNEKFRFRINVTPDIDTEDTYIPNMIIQPFLENSIIHGMAGKKNQEGMIDLNISRNGKLTCVVEDNGVGLKISKQQKQAVDGDHESMGSAITRKRIDMFNTMNSEKIELEMVDKSELGTSESGTRILIKFPLTSHN